ncbi:MAG: hypothetical protein IK133_09255 [Clostridia bacterium]|nr:hypothetical protein [Clostridia bacterium]
MSKPKWQTDNEEQALSWLQKRSISTRSLIKAAAQADSEKVRLAAADRIRGDKHLIELSFLLIQSGHTQDIENALKRVKSQRQLYEAIRDYNKYAARFITAPRFLSLIIESRPYNAPDVTRRAKIATSGYGDDPASRSRKAREIEAEVLETALSNADTEYLLKLACGGNRFEKEGSLAFKARVMLAEQHPEAALTADRGETIQLQTLAVDALKDVPAFKDMLLELYRRVDADGAPHDKQGFLRESIINKLRKGLGAEAFRNELREFYKKTDPDSLRLAIIDALYECDGPDPLLVELQQSFESEKSEQIRSVIVSHVDDPGMLIDILKHERSETIRELAALRLSDQATLQRIAEEDTEDMRVRKAAALRVTDPAKRKLYCKTLGTHDWISVGIKRTSSELYYYDEAVSRCAFCGEEKTEEIRQYAR